MSCNTSSSRPDNGSINFTGPERGACPNRANSAITFRVTEGTMEGMVQLHVISTSGARRNLLLGVWVVVEIHVLHYDDRM